MEGHGIGDEKELTSALAGVKKPTISDPTPTVVTDADSSRGRQ